MLRHRRSSLRASNLLRPLSLAAVCALVLSLGWVQAGRAAPAALQVEEEFPGVDGETYESPSWGYSLEWDERDWTVVGASSEDERDRLHLGSEGSDLVIVGFGGFEDDLETCRNDLIERITLGTDADPFEDEEGDPVEDADDERAFAAFLIEAPEEDEETGDPFVAAGEEAVAYVECRPLVEGEAVIQILHLAAVDDYLDEAGLAAEVLDTLTIPEAEDGEEEDAEPTEEADEDEGAEPTEEADEEPTEEADEDEEATEEAIGGAEPTEEAEEDEDEGAEPTEEADEDQDFEDAGVDGNTYTSPTFDYSLEWDEDEWEVEDASSEDDVDTLVLSDGVSTLTITGLEDFDGDPADCLEETAAELEDGRDVEDFEPALDPDGDPIEIEDDDRVGAVYAATVDGEAVLYRVECRILVEDEAVIQIVQEVPEGDFNDEIDPVDAVLDTLTLEGEEPVDGEGDGDGEGDDGGVDGGEDDGGEDDGADGDGGGEFADFGVDGTTYTSPEFGYTLEWDGDIWTVADAASQPGFDDLQLEGRNSFLEISGTTDFTDPLVCFETLVDFFSNDTPDFTVEDFDPFEDENGDVIEGEDDDRVFGAFLVVLANEDGVETELVYYFECRTLVEDESVLFVIQAVDPQAYEIEAERRDEILDTIELAGADEEEEEEPEEEEENGGNQDEDENQGDEDQDDDRDTADEPNLDSYTSRTFGYSFSYDRNVWTLTGRDVEDTRDFVELSSESGLLTIEGQTRFGGDPAACLNTATTNLRAIDGVQDWERVSDPSLLPDGRGRGGASAFFSFTLAPEGRTPTPYYAYVECRVLVPGESVLMIVYTVPVEDYEAEREALSQILTTVTMPEE